MARNVKRIDRSAMREAAGDSGEVKASRCGRGFGEALRGGKSFVGWVGSRRARFAAPDPVSGRSTGEVGALLPQRPLFSAEPAALAAPVRPYLGRSGVSCAPFLFWVRLMAARLICLRRESPQK